MLNYLNTIIKKYLKKNNCPFKKHSYNLVFRPAEMLRHRALRLCTSELHNLFVTFFSVFMLSFLVLKMKYEQNHSKPMAMKAFSSIVLLHISTTWYITLIIKYGTPSESMAKTIWYLYDMHDMTCILQHKGLLCISCPQEIRRWCVKWL